MKVLVLEDDPVSMAAITHDLEQWGHSVMQSKNSIEAFNIISKNLDINLVIVDLKLPNENGLDFIKDVRNISKKIPIVIVSGTVNTKSLKVAQKYNCKDILVKPHAKERLEKILHSIKK
ncbi:MAG: hypothetical protein CME62_15660 [Halobacteriovoraceae bacterium]|nr:hypothetical protein [Halobacteriovoraceae bacterium]|tara:strand:+ start:2917 stop:3273 length:357 start_codon:yes stop_codon:yes gene_type:complete